MQALAMGALYRLYRDPAWSWSYCHSGHPAALVGVIMNDGWGILPESQASFDRMHRQFVEELKDESVVQERKTRHCCFIQKDRAFCGLHGWTVGDVPCAATAEWIIVHGPAVDDYTEACTEHVGALLTDASEHRIYPIKESI